MRPPYELDVEQVGLLISSVAFSYMLLALPLGWLTDVLNQGSAAGRRLKSVQVCGWLGMLCGAALLGPARPLLAAAGSPTSLELAAFPIIGASCALKIIPTLPDLQRGLAAEDEAARAALCAMWNGLYCLGSAMGPLVATLMYDGIGWERTIQTLIGVSAATATMLVAVAARFD